MVAVVLKVTKPNRAFLAVKLEVKELKTLLTNVRVAWKLDSPCTDEEMSSMKPISHEAAKMDQDTKRRWR